MSIFDRASRASVSGPLDTRIQANAYSKSDDSRSTKSSGSPTAAEGPKAEVTTPLIQHFHHNLRGSKSRICKHLSPSKRVMAIATASVASIILLATLTYYLHHFRSLIPHNSLQQIIQLWDNPNSPTSNLTHFPTDFSSDIIPIPCHSHNDYLRHIPLYDALSAGCVSVEADVWLSESGDELHVGHSRNSLTPARTLHSLYIDPIVQILTRQNQPPVVSRDKPSIHAGKHGVFDVSPSTTLTLLVDIKSNGTETFPVVQAQLESFRSHGWLSHYNGSAVVPGLITVVATGNTPFSLLTKNTTYRDIFFDAPLDALWGEDLLTNSTLYSAENSYYASVSFTSTIGKPWLGTLTPEQVWKIRAQIRSATRKGLKSRYWDTPSWPIGVRDHVWDVLEREGVGALNVDDLESASKRKW